MLRLSIRTSKKGISLLTSVSTVNLMSGCLELREKLFRLIDRIENQKKYRQHIVYINMARLHRNYLNTLFHSTP